MSADLGGFLISFDEERRTSFLSVVRNVEGGFSDALSSVDWKLRQWEVCGLMFEPDLITHWALAHRGKKVATGKVRVEFTEVTPVRLSLPQIEQKVGPQIRSNIARARSGVGGRLANRTWQEMKSAVGAMDGGALAALERLERLRDQSRAVISRPGADIVAQQRDAVGVSLDAFDETGRLRRSVLRGWTPKGQGLSSFLDGLQGVKTIEDQLIARDAAAFPGALRTRHTVVGAVFSIGGRTLEVFNVNRAAVETSLGVDLIYWNQTFDAWTLVQYKLMEKSARDKDEISTYRPDEAFDDDLRRMKEFRVRCPDSFSAEDGQGAYRLAGDGFFFKFCSRVRLEVLSEALLPGMYLSREFVEALLTDPKAQGPRGGRAITFENARRHLTNTMFAELVRDGWIGTRGVSSSHVAAIVRERLTAGRAMVVARSRHLGSAPNPDETLGTLGL